MNPEISVSSVISLPPYIRGEEKAAVLMGFNSRESFREWTKKNKVEGFKDGRTWVFEGRELMRIMDEKKNRSVNEKKAKESITFNQNQRIKDLQSSLKAQRDKPK